MKEAYKQEAMERLAALEEETARLREIVNREEESAPTPTPLPDEVWEGVAGRRFLRNDPEDGQHCELPTSKCDAELWDDDVYAEANFVKRLGMFHEVYADRAKLREEGYFHRDEISQALAADQNEICHRQGPRYAYDARLFISDKLGIDY